MAARPHSGSGKAPCLMGGNEKSRAHREQIAESSPACAATAWFTIPRIVGGEWLPWAGGPYPQRALPVFIEQRRSTIPDGGDRCSPW